MSTVLDVTGLLSGISALRHRNICVVMMYHRVMKDLDRPRSSSHPGIIVSGENFKMQMKYVADHLHPMTLEDFEQHLTERKPFRPRSCLVTFDDGWVDNYEVAFPVLRSYRVPAAIFLPIDYISNDKMFWQEELFMRLSAQEEEGAPSVARAREIRNYVSGLKKGDTDAIARALDAARSDTANLDFRGHYNRYMSWNQVAEMQENGISFGSHACSHRILCNLSNDEQIRELSESKATIEEKLNQSVSALAYPNGDFDSNVVKNAKAAGYTIAFSTNRGLKNAKASGYTLSSSTNRGFCETASDEFAIPRMNIHDYNAPTTPMFRGTLLGLF